MEILIKEEYDKIERFLHNAQVRNINLFSIKSNLIFCLVLYNI